MRNLYKINLIISLILLVANIPLGLAEGEDFEPNVSTGEFLVGLKDFDEGVTAFLDENHYEVVRRIAQINVILVRAIDNLTTQEVKNTLADNPTVRFVEPNSLVQIPQTYFGQVIEAPQMKASSQVESTSIPNDPLWAFDTVTWQGQWNMRVIDLDEAWNINTGNKDVIVSVIDTGVYAGHHDLSANYIQGGYDWVNNDDNPHDDNGHGSWVAGIIAAETNNSYGVAGIAQVSIIAEKVLGSNGVGSIADVISGLVHSADLGVDIINLSLGTYSYSGAFKDAVDYAHSKGCLLVAAAGNQDTTRKHYPAAFGNVMAVAATYGEPNDTRASYSNYGSWITISAPGGDDENGDGSPNKGEHWIISTYNKQDHFLTSRGTSAATPHVSGLAALYKSQYPAATNEEIKEVIKITAVDKGDPGWDKHYGHGRINAYTALAPPIITSVGGEGKTISLHRRSMTAPWINVTSVIILSLFLTLIIKRGCFSKLKAES